MTGNCDRRSFLKISLAAGLTAPAYIRNLRAASPNEIVRHASFGAAGMAAADYSQLVTHPQLKLTCVADVDLDRAEALKTKFPEIRIYQDWRKLLDEESKNLDSVNVSTPDHMHAPIAMAAMNRGLNVYGQKPLTHDVYDSRRLAKLAAEKKLVTQMGIQVHSDVRYRSAVDLIQGGAIGKVQSVHSWSEKKWGDPEPRPDRSDPVPARFDWDLWQGVCETRPFIGGGYYHPGNWRRRLDFGTGTFGDMGCHIFDPVFKALALTAPLTLKSVGPAPNAHNWANNAVVHLTFPQTKYTIGPVIPITWYDGDQRPPKEITAQFLGDKPLPGQGSLFIGEKGALLLPHVADPILLPEKQYDGYSHPKLEPINHWHQYVDAIQGKGTPAANFSYAGPLTESVLLGGVATYFPNEELKWNAESLKFDNKPAADGIIRKPYRNGWAAGL